MCVYVCERETGRFELLTCSLSSNLGSTETLKPMGGLEEGEGDDDAAPMLQFEGGRSAGIIEQKATAVGTEMQIEEAERERDEITLWVTRRL